MIEFKNAQFIRLGKKSKWAKECIDTDILRLGYNSPMHNASLNGDWKSVLKYWKDKGKKQGMAQNYVNQIKKFYTLDENTIWITFHNRKLYYCFTNAPVEEYDHGGVRERITLNGWSCKDIEGNELTFDRLSTKLTKTQGFQGTICDVKEMKYLYNKINCKISDKTEKAKTIKIDMIRAIEPLLKELTWYDFEVLIDLIFSYSGWRRLETIGKTQKSIDLDLMIPVSGKRAFVQVKSKSDLAEYKEYLEDFDNMEQYNEFYYFVHSPAKNLDDKASSDNRIYTAPQIAELVFKCGLVDWVIEKTT